METQVEDSAFGHKVKQARDRRHLTQEEAAAEIGVATRTLQYWESGMTPKAKHRRAIVAWLDADQEQAA